MANPVAAQRFHQSMRDHVRASMCQEPFKSGAFKHLIDPRVHKSPEEAKEIGKAYADRVKELLEYHSALQVGIVYDEGTGFKDSSLDIASAFRKMGLKAELLPYTEELIPEIEKRQLEVAFINIPLDPVENMHQRIINTLTESSVPVIANPPQTYTYAGWRDTARDKLKSSGIDIPPGIIMLEGEARDLTDNEDFQDYDKVIRKPVARSKGEFPVFPKGQIFWEPLKPSYTTAGVEGRIQRSWLYEGYANGTEIDVIACGHFCTNLDGKFEYNISPVILMPAAGYSTDHPGEPIRFIGKIMGEVDGKASSIFRTNGTRLESRVKPLPFDLEIEKNILDVAEKAYLALECALPVVMTLRFHKGGEIPLIIDFDAFSDFSTPNERLGNMMHIIFGSNGKKYTTFVHDILRNGILRKMIDIEEALLARA